MFKSNRRKMFDFHTAVVLVVAVTSLCTCTIQASVDESNKQQHYNHYNNHQHINEKPHHQHLHHHHPHKSHQQHTTPSIGSTTNNPGLANGDGDNETTFKAGNELYKTITMNALTSTTSTPSQHHHNRQQHQLEKPLSNQRNGQHLILNSSSLSPSSSAVSNSNVEQHTHQRQQPQQDETRSRLVPTPLPPQQSDSLSATTPQYNPNGGGNQRSSSSTSINPLERSKYSSYSDAMERDNYMFHRPPGRPHYPHHPARQQEYNYDLRQHKPEEDYYEEYNEDDDGDDDEDDIDGFADDTDNNLSDRSYARITRSQLDVSILATYPNLYIHTVFYTCSPYHHLSVCLPSLLVFIWISCQ